MNGKDLWRKLKQRVRIRDPAILQESIKRNVDWELLFACTLHRLPVARDALSQGADVNCRRSDYLTPLHIAVQGNNVELIELLCDHRSVDIEARTIDGLSPLHKAVLLGHRRAIEKLIEHGASVNCTDHLDRYPLHYAVLRRDIRTAELLIRNGAQVNALDTFQESPLYGSVMRTPILSMINLLFNSGARICPVPNQHSLGLFLEAVLHSHSVADLEIIDLLYRNGADLDATDFIALRTPLHIVAMTGNLKLATYLIEKGADLNRKDRAGHTPTEVAETYKNYEIAGLINNSMMKSLKIENEFNVISTRRN